ncbi:MAG: helix-turn-helix transcriptional regulator [Kofleriaceae bacterium]|jgi:transcriptional regulator with XRE-family HTH domain|nr:helix-turn-helix transcriptional regulator [Kofleriaceae bacterium]
MLEVMVSRSEIGARLRDLREARRWTQAELAQRLAMSQPQVSQVERGLASLSAEQLLEALRVFNVTADHFAPSLRATVDVALGNAIARLGASQLRADHEVLPSARLAQVHEVLRESLVTGEARLLVALAPVLANAPRSVNAARLASELHPLGLAPRLFWLLEQIIVALRSEATRAPLAVARRYRVSAQQLERLLRFGAGLVGTNQPIDSLDPAGAPSPSKPLPDPIGRRWRVASALTSADFATALREARATA